MGRKMRIMYWYPNVLNMIKRYPGIKNEDTIQACIFTRAIERSIEDTLKLEYGDNRIKAIDMMCFRGTHSSEGVALELNFSSRTIQRWKRDFVYAVAKYAGYL